MNAQIIVEPQQVEDPTFGSGETRTARALMTNPTTAQFAYTAELYLGVRVATSGIKNFVITAGGSIYVDFPIIMPIVDGVYDVYLDVWSEGVLLAHFKATEDVTIVTAPAIDIGDITW